MVIRNPIDNKPIIPGSSIKGKMRALLDLNEGNISSGGGGQIKYISKVVENSPLSLLFGAISEKQDIKKFQHPSRLIVRDGKMTNADAFLNKTDLPYTESKTEVVIDRITSKAMPRTFERVPAGAEFNLNLVLNIFEHDSMEDTLIKHLFQGLRLLQDDYLGGGGSRGSGQVKIKLEAIYEKTAEDYKSGKAESDMAQIEIPNDLK